MTLGGLALIDIKMAFMVKNPGLMPGFDSLKNGDVTKRRKAMWDVLVGGWRACECLTYSLALIEIIDSVNDSHGLLETET